MIPGEGWPVARSRRRMKFAESEAEKEMVDTGEAIEAIGHKQRRL